MRLKVLYKYGGIYLDTDVSIVKSFDSLLEQPLFMGSESKYSICTAVIGAQAHSFLLRELLELYEGRRFLDKNGKMDQTDLRHSTETGNWMHMENLKCNNPDSEFFGQNIKLYAEDDYYNEKNRTCYPQGRFDVF